MKLKHRYLVAAVCVAAALLLFAAVARGADRLASCSPLGCVENRYQLVSRPPGPAIDANETTASTVRIYSAPTWADRQTGKATLNYCIGWAPANLDRAEVSRQIRAALDEWNRYVQIDFRLPYGQTADTGMVGCGGDRTLVFSWLPADHGDWQLSATNPAHAHLPPDAVPEPLAGDVHFWNGREWTPEEIYRTAVHEIGHALGLWESREGLMDSERNLLWLQASDIAAIRRLYARRCFGVECAWKWTP